VTTVPHLAVSDLCQIVAGHSKGRVTSTILMGATGPTEASSEVIITGISDNSDRVREGDLFVCIPGAHHDGHDHAVTAIAAGARALLVQRRLEVDCPQILVADTRTAVGEFAAAIHDHPSDALQVIGITGTNGKTTTAHLIAAIATAAGRKVRILGTLSGALTTPEATELQALLARWRSEGYDLVVMEVSSHALALHRVDGVSFDLAVFTNLGRDHLDLHRSMEEYFRAKARLFTTQFCARAVINTGDPYGALLADSVDIAVTPVDWGRLDDVEVTADRITARWAETKIFVPLGGHTNVANLSVALEVAEVLEIAPSVAATGLAAMEAIPGRFEVVASSRAEHDASPTVIVDFAHTPEGLSELLSSVRQLDGCDRVIVVFGCGGDRDKDKRPKMGQVAISAADLVIVTSDNPRSEDPDAIADEILRGVDQNSRDRVIVDQDRRSAIATAISSAGPHDVVLVAGKGHENTQTIGTEVVPFSDAAVVREILSHKQGEQK
jgi:UDP-N-acetylmuramoyl-L-alanyl-D-glutamate--2,6-diaminopimelate ligase